MGHTVRSSYRAAPVRFRLDLGKSEHRELGCCQLGGAVLTVPMSDLQEGRPDIIVGNGYFPSVL